MTRSLRLEWLEDRLTPASKSPAPILLPPVNNLQAGHLVIVNHAPTTTTVASGLTSTGGQSVSPMMGVPVSGTTGSSGSTGSSGGLSGSTGNPVGP
jgi:hypothetical protein